VEGKHRKSLSNATASKKTLCYKSCRDAPYDCCLLSKISLPSDSPKFIFISIARPNYSVWMRGKSVVFSTGLSFYEKSVDGANQEWWPFPFILEKAKATRVSNPQCVKGTSAGTAVWILTQLIHTTGWTDPARAQPTRQSTTEVITLSGSKIYLGGNGGFTLKGYGFVKVFKTVTPDGDIVDY